MTAGRYRAYPEYRNSGVGWVGKVPKHWKLTPLKYLCRFNGGGTPSKDNPDYWNGNVPWVSPKDMNQKRVTTTIDRITETAIAESSTSLVEAGALLMVVRSGILKHSIPVAINDVPVALNQDMKALRFNDRVNVDYAQHVLSGHQRSLLLEWSKQGATVESIEQEYLSNTYFPTPPIAEQNQISAFLDHETTKIDALIERQQQLIALLREKRQAVISHAVTKGLNPDAPMKDSGVKWLGEVPEHWGVSKAKYLFDFITSGSRGWAGYYADEGKLFFRIANLTRDTINPNLDSVQKVLTPSGSEGERAVIKFGDILISITADLGSVCLADKEIIGGYVSQHIALCRPNSRVRAARWIAYSFLSDSAKKQLLGAGYGGTKIQLSLEDIKDLWITIPPAIEQFDLAEYIDSQMKRFTNLMNMAEWQIQLLQERRTALISAAVTGKIDVRHWQPPPSISTPSKDTP